ncbi:MAG TPA: sortase [Candidatus Absconditabacterales bacterium]|nr:sortase [Candidatus Absconditabacterales bacterium]HNG96947.1 sortase [Candidatus Absconditabacterales bacterium]
MLTLDDLIIEQYQHKHEVYHASIDHYDYSTHKKQKSKSSLMFTWRDMGKIGLVVIVSFLVGNIVTNAGLYGEKIAELRNGVQQFHIGSTSDNAKFSQSPKQAYLDLMFKTQGHKTNQRDRIYSYHKTRAQTLDFQFNLLPPDNRIIIPELGLQAPIVTVNGDVTTKMKEGLFTDELKQGVVHYPTTPGPDEQGTTMIMGHTSNYFWVKSAYNTIFSKIPQLKEGQTIQLIWGGKMYEYEVKKHEIVKPTEVGKVYEKHYDHNEKKLALMGCYPVGTRDKRIIIFAEPKNNTQQAKNIQTAQHTAEPIKQG